MGRAGAALAARSSLGLGWVGDGVLDALCCPAVSCFLVDGIVHPDPDDGLLAAADAVAELDPGLEARARVASGMAVAIMSWFVRE